MAWRSSTPRAPAAKSRQSCSLTSTPAMVHAGLAIAKITAEDTEETDEVLRDVEDAE